jgi:outer membrane protein TolC
VNPGKGALAAPCGARFVASLGAWLAAALGAWLAAALATGPARAQVLSPQQPPAAPASATSAAPRGQPERVTLAEAVRRASVQATPTVVAAEELRRAAALLGEVRSAALPLLSGQGSYTHLDGDRRSASGVVAARDQESAAAVLQLPLVAPSRWSSWAHASEQVGVARASEADVRRQTVLSAARAYLAILAQKRVVDVSRSARDIAKVRFDFAHARRSGGIGNAVDELRSEQQLATSEVQLGNGELGLTRAQEALGVLTGSQGPLDAVEEPAFELVGAPGTAAAAEARRLDARAAQARLDAAAHVARDSWADWLPTVVATGQVFYQNPPTLLTPQTGWQVQFVLSLPIYEGGLRRAQRQERDALAREASASLDGTRRQVRSDVRLGLEEVARREAALASARLAAERGRAVLQLTVESYRAGATNDLDVSTAQQQSRDADLSAVVAEDAVRQARLDLLAGLGQFP